MNTTVTEIANGIYRVSTYVEQADLRFNQYLVDAEEPLIFHCGLLRLFPDGLFGGSTSCSSGANPVDFLRTRGSR